MENANFPDKKIPTIPPCFLLDFSLPIVEFPVLSGFPAFSEQQWQPGINWRFYLEHTHNTGVRLRVSDGHQRDHNLRQKPRKYFVRVAAHVLQTDE